MSNFASFLKTLDIDISIPNVSYVFYEPTTGRIEKITNKAVHDDVYSVLEVSHNSVADIINGIKSSENFLVEYDVALKQLALKEVTYEENLTKIDSKLYRLPVVRQTVNELGDKSSVVFDTIYDGVEVYIWVSGFEFPKGSLVWYKNNVYKLLDDLQTETFDEDKAEIFVPNVHVSDVKSLNHFVEYKTSFEPIFEGIHVDVWYRELPHLAGQHVWIYNNVYRLKEDQPANASFDVESAELIESNVYLYNDSNKYLTFVSDLEPGYKILDNNRLYLFTNKKLNVNRNEKSILFYTSKFEGLYVDNETNKMVSFSFVEKNNKLIAESTTLKDKIELESSTHFLSGQKVLIGKSLYQARNLEDRDIDVNVVQNNLAGCWEIYLGKRTKKSLEMINYIGNDTLYFSVTAKHDPNILYRTMEFSLSKLINNRMQVYPYQYTWEFDREDVSIYTSKFFETYSHEILE